MLNGKLLIWISAKALVNLNYNIWLLIILKIVKLKSNLRILVNDEKIKSPIV